MRVSNVSVGVSADDLEALIRFAHYMVPDASEELLEWYPNWSEWFVRCSCGANFTHRDANVAAWKSHVNFVVREAVDRGSLTDALPRAI